MPTETQARQVVAEVLKLPADGNRTFGKRGRVFADFELLRYPVYLPIMKELVDHGDARGLDAIGAMAFPEATETLIELTKHSAPAIAAKAMQLLVWRVPPIKDSKFPTRLNYLARGRGMIGRERP